VADVNPTSSNRRIEGRQRGDLEIVATRWTELRRHPVSVEVDQVSARVLAIADVRLQTLQNTNIVVAGVRPDSRVTRLLR
jgi:hypothetical protein